MITGNLFAEVTFEWKHEGKQVFLCGSFDSWKERKPMTKKDSSWTLTIALEPGTYSYKFIVDERWCFDIEKPNVADPFSGTSNNTLTIENWRQELIEERRKSRDQIEAESNQKYKSLYESSMRDLRNEFTEQLRHSKSQIEDLEVKLNKRNQELEESRKKVEDKRSKVEGEVRIKYDVLVNGLHNENIHLKAELEKERNTRKTEEVVFFDAANTGGKNNNSHNQVIDN